MERRVRKILFLMIFLLVIQQLSATVSFTPANPKVGETVVFTLTPATNLLVADRRINWNFGDGTPVVTTDISVRTRTHVYTSTGAFTVSVTYYLNLDVIEKVVDQALVMVTEEIVPVPPAEFDISYINLHFEDGKTAVSVPRNFSSLVAFADLKYKGTGIMTLQWLVDNMPFKIETVSLTFSGETSINSGTTPALPTQLTGNHEVTLKIIRPAVEFPIPVISYFVSLEEKTVNKPVITAVAPDTLQPGKEYELLFQGENLTEATAISFSGIAALGKPEVFSSLKAKMRVFVPPTANEGTRLAVASNEQGTSSGPGKVSIKTAVPETAMPLVQLSTLQIECPDVEEVVKKEGENLRLKTPGWEVTDWSKTVENQDGGIVHPSSPSGSHVQVPVLDDFTIFQWEETNPEAEYFELRFLDKAGEKIYLTRRLNGGIYSYLSSGAFVEELFDIIYPGGVEQYQPAQNTALVKKKIIRLVTEYNDYVSKQDGYNIYFSDGTPAQEHLVHYRQALLQADLTWQVAGYRHFECIRDVKNVLDIPGQGENRFNQDIEVEKTPVWPLRLPDRPKGIGCPTSGYQGSGLNAENQDRKSTATGTITSNYVGDRWILSGNFDLADSPYRAMARVLSNSGKKVVTFDNLFLDWGDGTRAVPLMAEVLGTSYGDVWQRSWQLRLIDSFWHMHTYHKTSNFTIRVFLLPENDIQQPSSNFYETLGETINPDETDNDPFHKLIYLTSTGPSETGNIPAAVPASGSSSLSGVLDRAYMIFCQTVTIDEKADPCALGPLQLVSIEIIDFPGHKNMESGNLTAQTDLFNKDNQEPAQGVHAQTNIDLGYEAFAVTCDQFLSGVARLTYFGKGKAQILWKVDGQVVFSERTPELSSDPRHNLKPGEGENCDEAIQSAKILQSGPLPVQVVGRHEVTVEARVIPDASHENLYQVLCSAIEDFSQNSQAGGSNTGNYLLSGKGPLASGDRAAASQAGNNSSAYSAAWLNELTKNSQTVGIGFLNSSQHASGLPMVASIQALKAEPPDLFPEGACDPPLCVVSETIPYLVTRPNAEMPCSFVFPTTGGDFLVTDFNQTIHKTGNTYNGQGILNFVLTQNSSGYKKYPVVFDIKDWEVDNSNRVINGVIDVDPNQPIAAPAVQGTLNHVHGRVQNGNKENLLVTLSLEVNDASLRDMDNNATHPGWKQKTATLSANGDWIFNRDFDQNLVLEQVQFSWTNFQIQANNVVLDLSRSENCPGKELVGDWTGVYLGSPDIKANTFDLAPSQPFNMIPKKDWVIESSGVSGQAIGNNFQSNIHEGFIAVDEINFSADKSNYTALYNGVRIRNPWLEPELTGDARLKKVGNEFEISWDSVGLAEPVVKNLGNLTMKSFNLQFTSQYGWKVKSDTGFEFRAEGKNLAQVSAIPLFFGFDGYAYLPNGSGHFLKGLSGLSTLGHFPLTLQSLDLEASPTTVGGENRLGFGISARLTLSRSNLIPAKNILVKYRVLRGTGGYYVSGPATDPLDLNIEYPQVSQYTRSQVSGLHYIPPAQGQAFNLIPLKGDPLAFDPAIPASPNPGPAGDGVSISEGGTRFEGQVKLNMIGVPNINARLVMGYNTQGEDYFIIYADYTPPGGFALFPGWVNVFKVGGGLSYNFHQDVFKALDQGGTVQPDFSGLTQFGANVDMGHPAGFWYWMKGYFLINDNGAGFDFDNWLLSSEHTGSPHFQGHMGFTGDGFDGKIWGSRSLFGDLIVFSLGNQSNPAVDLHFGSGDYHIYLGQEYGSKISAKILIAQCDAFLIIGNQCGMKVGGGLNVNLEVGSSNVLSAYARGWMDVVLGINPSPFSLSGRFKAEVEAGCSFLKFDVSESLTAEIWAAVPAPPKPFNLKTKVTIDHSWHPAITFTVSLF